MEAAWEHAVASGIHLRTFHDLRRDARHGRGAAGRQTRFTLTTSNSGAPAIAPEFTSFYEFSDAIIGARIDMGFHFRSACGLGQFIGERVAWAIVETALASAVGQWTTQPYGAGTGWTRR